MAFSFTYPTPLPSTKGWGPGWSSADTTCSAIRPHIKPHPLFAGGVHEDIEALVNLLVTEIERRGYDFQIPGCWGFACRGTKSSSGATGGTPSFHSWGLALDFNAPQNVFGSAESQSDIASNNRWIVKLMREYGFYWLGPPIRDWMHFSFVGNRRDARRMTRKARANLTPSYVVGGEEFKRLTRAFRRARLLLEDGKELVKVRRK